MLNNTDPDWRARLTYIDRLGSAVDVDRTINALWLGCTDLMCLIDQRERRFTDVNPSWERVLGWTRKELCAVPYTHFMHPEDVCIAEFEDNLANQRTTGGYSLLNRYRNKEGKWITLEWYAAIFGPSINYAVAKIFHTAKIVENPSLFTEVSDAT